MNDKFQVHVSSQREFDAVKDYLEKKGGKIYPKYDPGCPNYHLFSCGAWNPTVHQRDGFEDYKPLTFKEFEQKYLKGAHQTSRKLPTRWAVRRNKSTYRAVNDWFAKTYGRQYKSDGTAITNTGNRDHDFLHYPMVQGSKVVLPYIANGYEEIDYEEFLSIDKDPSTPAPLPAKWAVMVTEESREALGGWRRMGRLSNTGGYCLSEGPDSHNKDAHGYYDNKLPSGYQEITFEQFKTHILKQPTMAETKKVLGYKCPINLADGSFPAGTIYRGKGYKGINNPSYYYPEVRDTINSANGIPKEIVETWEPVYEESFKAGDYLYVINTGGFGGRNVSRAGDVIQLTSMDNGIMTSYPYRVTFTNGDIAAGHSEDDFKTHFRKATAEEIKNAQTVRVGSHTAEFGKDYVKFGCQRFSIPQVEALDDLFKRSNDVKVELSLDGNPITHIMVSKVLAKLKSK